MLYTDEHDYLPQVRWEPELKGHGYRGFPITAAEDFAEPYVEVPEEDWSLI